MTGGYDASKNIQIGRFSISDSHGKYRWLSTPEIFMYSSNIRSVKMAQDVGTPGQRAFLDKLHMLAPPQIELPEVGRPQIPMPWRPINTMTIAFGHGISVSPLQLIAGTGAIINGGVMIRPTLVKREEFEPIKGDRVISQKTSENMRRLMRLVVEQGTGKEAATPGYLVGGKTGTAEKVGRGGYKHKALLSSFMAAFPMNDPQYLVLVMMDEPQGTKETYGYATGGWVSAPSARRIIARMAPMLGLPPQDENAPDIRRAMAIDLQGGGPRVAAR
jgi:cell division protein FtsI (penicillin-binding protein 3)